MNFDSLWGLGFGTAVFFMVVLGLFYVKKLLRNRFFPKDAGRDRSEAMAELLALQASLQQKADQDPSGQKGVPGAAGGDPDE